jgi:hypothetical protein
MHGNIKLEAQKLVSDGITADICNQILDTHGKLWVIKPY